MALLTVLIALTVNPSPRL